MIYDISQCQQWQRLTVNSTTDLTPMLLTLAAHEAHACAYSMCLRDWALRDGGGWGGVIRDSIGYCST